MSTLKTEPTPALESLILVCWASFTFSPHLIIFFSVKSRSMVPGYIQFLAAFMYLRPEA